MITESLNFQNELKNKYKNEEIVRILNPRQVYFYMDMGLYPLWLEKGYDEKIVYVFLKELTLKAFSEWRNKNTNWKNK